MKAYKASVVKGEGKWFRVFDPAGSFAFTQNVSEAERIAEQCTNSGRRLFLKKSALAGSWIVMDDDSMVGDFKHRKDARAMMLSLRRKAISKKLRAA